MITVCLSLRMHIIYLHYDMNWQLGFDLTWILLRFWFSCKMHLQGWVVVLLVATNEFDNIVALHCLFALLVLVDVAVHCSVLLG